MTDNNFLINSAAITDRGLSEKRPQNEDSYLEMPSLGLFAVADGVGGAQAGDVASQMAMEILGEAFVNLQSSSDAEAMMRVAIERANNAIYQMSLDLPQLSTMATTVVALHIAGNIATIGHVGDSRLYRLDARGNLYRETQDHSVVEEEVRAGRMTAAQAANHPSRNVISRALGAESAVEVDMKTIMFEANSTFLLCSDGITRHISDFEIRDLLLTSQDPALICAKMKEICYSRGAEDNLTAVIIRAVGATVSAGSNGSNEVMPVEAEEQTVAAARTAPAQPVPVFAAVPENVEDDEIPTQNLQLPESVRIAEPAETPIANEFAGREEITEPVSSSAYTDTDEQFLMEEPPAPGYAEETAAAETTAASAAAASSIAASPVPSAPASETYPAKTPRLVRPEKEFTVFTEPEKQGSGIFGKIVSSLLWLIVGGLLGATALYLWMQMNPVQTEVPKLPPQTNTITFASYEKIRREVDANPDAVIANYEKTPPRDAADFYLLGRAKLLAKTKDYEGARNAFIEARNQLKDYKEQDNKTNLANDITMGLTIVQNEAARLAFERELKFINGADPTTQPNSNVSGGNSATGSF